MNKKDEDEFRRIAYILANQGDIDCLLDIIPDKIKLEYIKSWHNDEGLSDSEVECDE